MKDHPHALSRSFVNRRDLSGILTASAGVVALAVACSANAQTTVLSRPVGVMSAAAPKHESPMAFPLIAADIFVGVASGNSDSQVAFPDSNGDIGSRLDADRRYYLEVETGPLEGERFDVDTDATTSAAGPVVAIDLGDDSFSTVSGLPGDALAGARLVLRPFVTLDDVRLMFSPGLAGTKHGRSGDGVWMLGDNGVERFYLGEDDASWYQNNGGGLGKWASKHGRWHDRHGWKHGKKNPVDYRDLVLPPDVSIAIDIMSRPQTWTLAGVVRTNAFRKNLEIGLQSFATGFPVALSPVDIGAFVDPADPQQPYRWTGNKLFLRADQFEILAQGEHNFDLYYLRADGETWSKLGTHPKNNYAAAPILGPTDMILLWRFRPDPEFTIARPFDL